MARYEISGGTRTNYRGSEEDWKPTQKFIEAWRQKSEKDLPRCSILIRDVNYATDEKIDGVRTAHYEFETTYGITEYRNLGGGGVMCERENPNPWTNQECLMADVILPYDWFNPETEGIEPGYIQVRLAAPGVGLNQSELLLAKARELERDYCYMCDLEYRGSHIEITARNEGAKFSVKIAPFTF